MVEDQTNALRGNPGAEAKACLERLAALDRKRGGYLDLAAEGIIGPDELRAKLAELQEARETAERELSAIEEGRKERLEQLECDRNAVLKTYSSVVPDTLEDLGPEERHQLYKMLRLEVLAYPDKSLEMSGAIVARGGELDGAGTSSAGTAEAPTSTLGLGALGLTQRRSSRRPRTTIGTSPAAELLDCTAD